jgi:hypothetical protein
MRCCCSTCGFIPADSPGTPSEFRPRLRSGFGRLYGTGPRSLSRMGQSRRATEPLGRFFTLGSPHSAASVAAGGRESRPRPRRRAPQEPPASTAPGRGPRPACGMPRGAAWPAQAAAARPAQSSARPRRGCAQSKARGWAVHHQAPADHRRSARIEFTLPGTTFESGIRSSSILLVVKQIWYSSGAVRSHHPVRRRTTAAPRR